MCKKLPLPGFIPQNSIGNHFGQQGTWRTGLESDEPTTMKLMTLESRMAIPISSFFPMCVGGGNRNPFHVPPKPYGHLNELVRCTISEWRAYKEKFSVLTALALLCSWLLQQSQIVKCESDGRSSHCSTAECDKPLRHRPSAVRVNVALSLDCQSCVSGDSAPVATESAWPQETVTAPLTTCVAPAQVAECVAPAPAGNVARAQ